MFFGKSETKVEKMIGEHAGLVAECLSHLEKVVEEFLAGDENFVETSYILHKDEHRADEVRRAIQAEIAKGAFLPFYRTDYILLAEMIDKVANRAVDFSKALVIERPKFPPRLHPDLRALAKGVAAAYGPLRTAVEILFTKPEQAPALAEKVSQGEQETDSIEWKLLKEVFSEGIDRAEQIYLRDTVQRLASIADAAENASDRIRILLTKQAT